MDVFGAEAGVEDGAGHGVEEGDLLVGEGLIGVVGVGEVGHYSFEADVFAFFDYGEEFVDLIRGDAEAIHTGVEFEVDMDGATEASNGAEGVEIFDDEGGFFGV